MQMMEEYGKNADWRQAAREAGVATEQATASTVGRAKEAQTSAEESKAALAKGTLQGDIAAKNAKSRSEVTQSAYDQLQTATDILDATFNPSSPMALADYSKKLDEAGIPKDHPMRRLEQARTPEEFQAGYGAMRSAIQNNLAQRRKMEAQAAMDKAHMDRTKAEIDGRLEVARIQAKAHVEAAGQRKTAQQAKLESDLVELLQKARAETDPTKQAAIMKEANMVTMILQSIKAAGAPMYPQIPGIEYGAPNRVPGIQGQSNAPAGGPPPGAVRERK
jgi:hypothetical protein